MSEAVKPLTHVIYHDHCPDGFGAAWACHTYAMRLRGEDRLVYIPATYNTPAPELPPDAHVIIGDFSYPKAELQKLRSRVASVTVIDHHHTAQEDLRGEPNTIFDMTHSGAWLVWDYLFPCEQNDLIDLCNDRDLWQWKVKDSREIWAAIFSYPFTFDEWTKHARNLTFLAVEGKHIRRSALQAAERICENARHLEIAGYNVPVINTPTLWGECFDLMAEQHKDAAFFANYFDRADGFQNWTVRSNQPGFDVSVIAKQFGGGGHKVVAGFRRPCAIRASVNPMEG